MIIHNEAEQMFGYFIAEQLIGKLCYRYLNEAVIDAYHTKVEEQFQGKGIANDLYEALVDFAEKEQLKIKASCHYVQIKLERGKSELLMR